MLLSKLIVTSYLLACCEVGDARRIVSHLQTARGALESSRQILIAIQQEMPSDEEDGKDIAKYEAKKISEKCEQLKQEEAHHTDQANASAFRNLKDKLKESKLCSENGDNVISSLSEKVKNPAIAKWICTQGFELAEIKVDESACHETSELLLGGLQELSGSGEPTVQAAKLGLYLVRAAVILTPLPGPLGWILDKATEKLLKQLTQDAEEALDNLEKLLQRLEQKMWDISRKVVAEEFLRVGGEQVKVAEDQVKDIESIEEDDLWRDLMIDSVDSSSGQVQKIMDAAEKATSFNRWAAIEQSLATSLAILRPPDFMDTSDEMEPFIRVMKIHFMIELTVLSHMFKVVKNTSGKSFKKMVVAKAHRAALAVFPYLFIIGGDQALLETLKSPLLQPDPVENPERNPCKETGHSLVCVWLELLSHSSKRDAQTFKRPQVFCKRERLSDSKYYQQTQTFDFGTHDGEGEGFGVFIHYVNNTEELLNFKCSRDEQYISQFQEIRDESKYWGKDTVAGKCTKLEKGRVKRHLKVTFSGSLCSNKLTYGDVSVGELVSVKFEEETHEQVPCDHPHWQFSRKLKSSTCYISNIYMP